VYGLSCDTEIVDPRKEFFVATPCKNGHTLAINETEQIDLSLRNRREYKEMNRPIQARGKKRILVKRTVGSETRSEDTSDPVVRPQVQESALLDIGIGEIAVEVAADRARVGVAIA
jgi:hypothetical protein